MPDNIVEILLKLTADVKGGPLTVAEIEKVKAAATDAGKESVKAAEAGGEAAKEHSGHIQGLHRAVGFLGRQFGEVGHIAHFAFNPATIAIAAVAIAIHKAKEAFDEWDKTLSESEAANAEALGPTADKMREIQNEIIAADKLFKDYEATSKRESDKIVGNINAEHDALVAKAKTMEKIALATATSEEEKKSIREKYEFLNDELTVRNKIAVAQAKEKDLIQDRQQLFKQEEKAGALGALSPEAAELRLKMIPAELESAQRLIDRQKEKLAKAPKGDTVTSAAYPGVQFPNVERQEAERGLAYAEDFKRRLGEEQTRLTTGVTAAGDVKSLNIKIDALVNELGKLNQGIATGQFAAAGNRLAAAEAGAGAAANEMRGGGVALLTGIARLASNIVTYTDAVSKLTAANKALESRVNQPPP